MKKFKASFPKKKRLVVLIGLALASSGYAQNEEEIEEIQVVGNRAALMNALNKQRNSDKIAGVVDSDGMGNFADINVSESLRRISGIMVENDQGEGRYVTVRGMNADLNAMTINGVSTASPEDRRGIMLDGVPTDMLESMTVYKTLTPNLDADTIGGAIDLETISAFSHKETYARVKVESSYNELTEDFNNPSLSFTATKRFKMENGELGAALSLSDQSRHIIAHNNENGGWSELAPNDDYEMRFYDLTRDRRGVVLNLDYKTDAGNTFYVHGFHNLYTDEEYRGKWETRDGLEDNDAVISGNTFTYADTKVDTESRQRTEDREISAMQMGAKFELDSGNTINFEIFGSTAEQDDRNKYAAIFRSDVIDVPVTYDNSDPQQPVVSYADEFYDPETFELKAWEREVGLTNDEDIGVKFDMTYGLNDNTELQYGFKFRQREKENNFNYCGYEPVDDSTLADYEWKNTESYLNSVHGPALTGNGVLSFISKLGTGNVVLLDGTTCQAPGTFFEMSGDENEESIPADWLTEEDVMAGYVMATTSLEKTTLIYGLRYEDTSATYNGKNYDDFAKSYEGVTSFNKDYSFWAPSLNVKFEMAEDQIARLGIFRSMVRPGFKESNAGAVIDTEDNKISGGNPTLDPTTAWNFDLSYEYYMAEETFIGGGIFYKSIKDSIVEVEGNEIFFREQLWSQAGTYINTDDSNIYGIELSFQTALENGLVFVFNYTHSDGESDLPSDSVNGQRTIPYFKQASDTANAMVGYDKGAWDVRLAANYRSKYLDEIGDDALFDRYTDDHLQIDLTAKYRVNENLVINAAAMNLNDRPEYYYFGNDQRLSQYDEYGVTYTLGAKYTF